METKSLKYFAKYLPVEGEIKNGDMMLGGAEDESEGEIWMCDNHFISPEDKKVKLFLCSRDIKVGDKVKIPLTKDEFENNEFDYEGIVNSIGNNEINLNVNGDNLPFPKNYCIKLIGEISSKAVWVTEGMEFDEDEIQLLAKCLLVPSESCYIDTLGEFKNWNPTSYKLIIEIKCPTCKTFH